MKISISDVKIEKLCLELKNIGFDGIDLNFPSWDKNIDFLSKDFENSIIKKYETIINAGLEVSQAHLTFYPGHFEPLGDGSYNDFEKVMLPILIREIEILSKINCRIAVIHLFFDATREKSQTGNIELISKLLPILNEFNIVLAIENIYGPNYGDVFLSTYEDLSFYTNYFNSKHIGICLDIGHAITRNENPIEMLKKLNKNICALHIHSNIFANDLHILPCFIDNVDWRAFYNALIDIGYEGSFNMEIYAPRQLNYKSALLFYQMAYSIADSLIKQETKNWMDQ